jgi:hypothetical protein
MTSLSKDLPARYASDEPVENPAWTFLVTSAIARGRVAGFRLEEARAVPGVLDILTHENTAGQVKPLPPTKGGGSSTTTMEDDRIWHDGQIIALVVAESYEAAREAAHKIGVSYAEEAPAASFDSPGAESVPLAEASKGHEDPEVGDAARALATAEVTVDARYATPTQHHNPIELFATTGREETPKLQFNPLSGRWMRDHTRLQRHIGAAIAHNIWQHMLATGDEDFLAEHGAVVIIEIARFWASLARFDPPTGRWRIRGVVGPDEYHNAYPGAASPGIDDNAYTNVMAAWTLWRARDVLDRLPAPRRESLSAELGLGAEEPEQWARVARGLRLSFHEDGILAQFDGFDRLRPLDLRAMAEAHPGQRVDWVLEALGETADAHQAVKQADALMLPHLLPDGELEEILGRMGYRLDAEDWRRAAAWYLARTTHDSSLSRVVWAGALARLDPDASWRLFREAIRAERDPSSASAAADGIHLGAMGGIFDVLQRHYLGFQLREDAILLDPAPPAELGRVRLGLRCRFGAFVLEWSGSALVLHADAANPAAVSVLHPKGSTALPPGEEISVSPG